MVFGVKGLEFIGFSAKGLGFGDQGLGNQGQTLLKQSAPKLYLSYLGPYMQA